MIKQLISTVRLLCLKKWYTNSPLVLFPILISSLNQLLLSYVVVRTSEKTFYEMFLMYRFFKMSSIKKDTISKNNKHEIWVSFTCQYHYIQSQILAFTCLPQSNRRNVEKGQRAQNILRMLNLFFCFCPAELLSDMTLQD